MILMLLWLLSKEEDEKLYGLINVGLYTIFSHVETSKHLNNNIFVYLDNYMFKLKHYKVLFLF